MLGSACLVSDKKPKVTEILNCKVIFSVSKTGEMPHYDVAPSSLLTSINFNRSSATLQCVICVNYDEAFRP